MRRKQIVLTKKWEDYINKHVNKKFLIFVLGPSFDTINLEDYKDIPDVQDLPDPEAKPEPVPE